MGRHLRLMRRSGPLDGTASSEGGYADQVSLGFLTNVSRASNPAGPIAADAGMLAVQTRHLRRRPGSRPRPQRHPLTLAVRRLPAGTGDPPSETAHKSFQQDWLEEARRSPPPGSPTPCQCTFPFSGSSPRCASLNSPSRRATVRAIVSMPCVRPTPFARDSERHSVLVRILVLPRSHVDDQQRHYLHQVVSSHVPPPSVSTGWRSTTPIRCPVSFHRSRASATSCVPLANERSRCRLKSCWTRDCLFRLSSLLVVRFRFCLCCRYLPLLRVMRLCAATPRTQEGARVVPVRGRGRCSTSLRCVVNPALPRTQ